MSLQSNHRLNGIQRTKYVRAAARSTNTASAVHALESYRVLVVDDDETLLAIVRLSLAKDGLTVDTATSAAAALVLFATDPVDLVILDIVLPDLSGWEALRRIREASDVPVLILSARPSRVSCATDTGASRMARAAFR
jgi:CheY-like chemotaxis protein